MEIYSILILAHIIGTILGAGGATMAEVQVIKALKNGEMDLSERFLLHADYTVLRIGMALIIISGLAMIFWNLSLGNDWVTTSPKLLFKYSLILFIIINAVFISKHWVPLWLGSAISFTSWWMATILGFGRGINYTFLQFFIGYIVTIFIVAGILALIRKYYYSV